MTIKEVDGVDGTERVGSGGGNRTREKGNSRSQRLPYIVIYFLQTKPITISDRFQTQLGLFPLVPIPPPSLPIN